MKHNTHYRVRLAIFTFILLIVSVICLVYDSETSSNYTEEDEANEEPETYATIRGGIIEAVKLPKIDEIAKASISENETQPTQSPQWAFTEAEVHMLTKIAMAEAESESQESKQLIICVVLNRLKSDEFPNTIYDVIFQESNGVYQFTPIGNGRYEKVEPDAECYDALKEVMYGWDESYGALYFEACKEKTWHDRALTFIKQVDAIRFYK